jgi:integrase
MAERRGRNEGSIWKERNRYRAAISMNGRRLTRSFFTKSDCVAWLREMSTQVDCGLTYRNTRLTVGQYFEEWLSTHVLHLRQKTSPQYQQITRDYILPVLGHYRLKDLRYEHVDNLYRTLLSKDVSARTIRYVHSILHRGLEDAVRRGILLRNPAHGVRLPRKEHFEMRFFDEHQVMQFLQAAKGSRYEALYHLAVKTGMRQGELLGLKWSDLDWKKGALRIRRQLQRVNGHGRILTSPKTKNAYRTILLGEQTLQALRLHLEFQNMERRFLVKYDPVMDLIFVSSVGTPVEVSNMIKDYKLVLAKAGLPLIRFHDLRHTAATLMLNNGVPVLVASKILGHSKASTTLDIYGHLIPAMQEEAARIMDDLFTAIPIELPGNAAVNRGAGKPRPESLPGAAV